MKNSDTRVRVLSAEVLGLIGAIDPGRLPLSKALVCSAEGNVAEVVPGSLYISLAQNKLESQEYAEALMHLETHFMEHQDSDQDEDTLTLLLTIYAYLNEVDSVNGVLAVQSTLPKLPQAVMAHQAAGHHQDALACLELMAAQQGGTPGKVQLGIIKSLLDLDQQSIALAMAESALRKEPECNRDFLEAQIECFWRLSDYDALENVLQNSELRESTAWSVLVGRCLVDIQNRDQASLQAHMSVSRTVLANEISKSNYFKGYPHLVNLHLLEDLSRVSNLILSPMSSTQELRQQTELCDERLALVQASFKQPMLRLHRVLLQLVVRVQLGSTALSLLSEKLGASWLKSAEVARMEGLYQEAYKFLLNAQVYAPVGHFLELAKLQWAKKGKVKAVLTLEKGLTKCLSMNEGIYNMPDDVEEKKICAEAKLLLTIFHDKSHNLDPETLKEEYKMSTRFRQNYEESWFHFAQYCDRLASDDSKDVQIEALYAYLKALACGSNNTDQAMSRALSIWLDSGALYSETSKTDRQPLLILLDKMNKLMEAHANRIPAYTLMAGLAQLISRWNHPVDIVCKLISEILVKLLKRFPNQVMWMLLGVVNSNEATKKGQCDRLFKHKQVTCSRELVQVVNSFLRLGKLLINLSRLPASKGMNVSTVCKDSPAFLKSSSYSPLMVPLQTCRNLCLPQKDLGLSSNHAPFPEHYPTIRGIKEEIECLRSMRKPRKISFLGSNGKEYPFMLKDKDDLRCDASVMEFNCLVNKDLQKAAAARSRRLGIKTYSVVPLDDLCGVIEWVPNMVPLRSLIHDVYKQLGCANDVAELRDKFRLNDAQYVKMLRLEDRRRIFENELLPKFPPVFQKWFKNNFSDSQSWFESKKLFSRTAAVMSMVGYVLGLGDRHGSNILVDVSSGNVMHVDFNCIFNKGEKLDLPEKVPFRLTRNMIAAMGPCGVEGVFRAACKTTLEVLRASQSTVVSVLRPFVYDHNNNLAGENLGNIQQRLKGVVEKSSLSVEGQASRVPHQKSH